MRTYLKSIYISHIPFFTLCPFIASAHDHNYAGFLLTIEMKASMWGQNVELWEVSVIALCSASISWFIFVAKDLGGGCAHSPLFPQLIYCCWVPRGVVAAKLLWQGFIACCSPVIILTLSTHTMYLSDQDFVNRDTPSFIGIDYLSGKTYFLFVTLRGGPEWEVLFLAKNFLWVAGFPVGYQKPTNMLP